MTPERWRKIEEIFQTVIEQPPDERRSMLTQYCGADAELRRELEALLAQDETDEFLQSPIKDAAKSLTRPSEDDLIGQRIGPYHILELLGQGGMGLVYLAERADAEYYRQVALKVIRRGMDTRFALNRFRHERQILATLDHPNIARMLDGGTTEDGRPYFVMEYIIGRPLTEYCDAHRLSINDRLRLFLPVCAAVQHAHQKLIVHRDLKPSNILVTSTEGRGEGKGDGKEAGIPKLLDFGIAKLLDPGLSPIAITRTMTSLRMMTPHYASPEQVRGEPITTASDIYSLGVSLYELLTGERPHRFETYTPAEIERVICETAVERPSVAAQRTNGPTTRLRKQLTGDLDNIVLMAMRKEPARRYQSVEQFAEDIRRYLEGRPISARRESLVYRADKFVRRNKIGVAAVGLVLFSLIGALFVSNYQARRAERRFQQVRKLSNTFLFEFHNEIRDLPGSTRARELVVKTALEYLDSLAQESAGDTELETELAIAYQKVGDVQGDPWTPNLGRTAEAMASYRKSLTLAERLAARGSADLKAKRMLAQDYFKLGALLSESGDKTAAQSILRQGVGVAEAIEQQTGEESDFSLVMNFHVRIGNTRLDMGDPAGGLESYRKAQQLAERRVAAFPNHSAKASLAVASNHVGEGLLVLGDLVGAVEQYRRSQTIDEELVKQAPANAAYRRHLEITYGWLGGLYGGPRYINLGDPSTARQYYEKSVAIAEPLAAADSKNARAQLDLAISYGSLGTLLTEPDPARSVEYYQRGLAVLRGLLSISPDEYSYLRREAGQLRGLAEARRKLGDRRGALETFRQAQAIWQKLTDRDPAYRDIRAGLQSTLLALSGLLQEMGDSASAMDLGRQAMTLAEQEEQAEPASLYARWRLADSYAGLGKLHESIALTPNFSSEQRLALHREACSWRRKALEVWDGWTQRGVSSVFNTTKREQAAQALAQCEAQAAKAGGSHIH
jgi:serine/threonine protein kinase